MELTEKIFETIIENHQGAIGIHEKEREGGNYHSHTVINPTNYRDGSMLYGDNKTNYGIAQRVADVTENSVKLIVRYDIPDGKPEEWECKSIFVPTSDEVDE